MKKKKILILNLLAIFRGLGFDVLSELDGSILWFFFPLFFDDWHEEEKNWKQSIILYWNKAK